MASLSTCHLELVVWDGNLVKSCPSVPPVMESSREQSSPILFSAYMDGLFERLEWCGMPHGQPLYGSHRICR